MIYFYRVGFVIFTIFVFLGSFIERGPLPGDSLAVRLSLDPEAWNFTFSKFDSRFDPANSKPLLIKFIDRKRKSLDGLDLILACSAIAAFFCLIGWIRERKIEKQAEQGAAANP